MLMTCNDGKEEGENELEVRRAPLGSRGRPRLAVFHRWTGRYHEPTLVGDWNVNNTSLWAAYRATGRDKEVDVESYRPVGGPYCISGWGASREAAHRNCLDSLLLHDEVDLLVLWEYADRDRPNSDYSRQLQAPNPDLAITDPAYVIFESESKVTSRKGARITTYRSWCFAQRFVERQGYRYAQQSAAGEECQILPSQTPS